MKIMRLVLPSYTVRVKVKEAEVAVAAARIWAVLATCFRPQCVVSCPQAIQPFSSALRPKGVILAALDTLPACLKGASCGLKAVPAFRLMLRLGYYRLRLSRHLI